LSQSIRTISVQAVRLLPSISGGNCATDSIKVLGHILKARQELDVMVHHELQTLAKSRVRR
jgi:hypothetical protein